MLAATVLGSGMALLDTTVVNVALPHIGTDLDAGVGGLQWTVNGYLLTLSALILLGGALGDLMGRRRIFVVGTVAFAAASVLCGLAPSVETLVVARMLQGAGGALLTPGSLAVVSATFAPADRGRAIGAWSGLMGIFGASGPFVGGWLIEALSWRWVFFLNVPVAVAVVLVARRWVPESRGADDGTTAADDGGRPARAGVVQRLRRLDVVGAVLAAAALGLVSAALVAAPDRGATDPLVVGTGLGGLLATAGFVLAERRVAHPMVPPDLFSSAAFLVANAVTFVMYAALGGVAFVLVLTLQVVMGYGALEAGAALLPVSVLMLLLSPSVGGLTTRTGPRLPMTAGPLLAGTGIALAASLGADAAYWTDVVPRIAVFGLGMSLTVAPLTTTAMAAAPDRYAGIASGVNTAVARAAGLLAVAALPLLVGLAGDAYRDPGVLLPAYRTAMLGCAAMLALGGLLALLGLPGRTPAAAPEPPVAPG